MQRYADSRFTGAFRPNVGELAAGRNSPHREDLGGPFHLTSQYRGTCGGGRAWRRKPGQAVRHESRYFAARGARAYPFSLERIDQLFDEIDVLLCPVSSITAPPQTPDETIIAIFENDHRNIIRLTRLTSFWAHKIQLTASNDSQKLMRPSTSSVEGGNDRSARHRSDGLWSQLRLLERIQRRCLGVIKGELIAGSWR